MKRAKNRNPDMQDCRVINSETKKEIILENPAEIWGPHGPNDRYGHCVGAKLLFFEAKTDPEQVGSWGAEAYNATEEIVLDFDNGKEMRIYINEDGNLSVYTD